MTFSKGLLTDEAAFWKLRGDGGGGVGWRLVEGGKGGRCGERGRSRPFTIRLWALTKRSLELYQSDDECIIMNVSVVFLDMCQYSGAVGPISGLLCMSYFWL